MHERSPPTVPDDQAILLERPQRFSDRVAAHAEMAHELHLRRELFLRTPFPRLDLGTQHALDLIVQRDRRMVRGSQIRRHYVPRLVQKAISPVKRKSCAAEVSRLAHLKRA